MVGLDILVVTLIMKLREFHQALRAEPVKDDDDISDCFVPGAGIDYQPPPKKKASLRLVK